MRHRTSVHRWYTVTFALALVVAACGGSDESTADVDAPDPPADSGTAPDADSDDDGGSDPPSDTASENELTIERLCDPVEPAVVAVLGDAVTTVHNDFYADRADKILDCGWESTELDRTIRVGFNGAPNDPNAYAGKQDLAAVDAPNVYAVSRTDLRAPNGWTVTIQNLGADQQDEPDAIAAIANAALAAIEP